MISHNELMALVAEAAHQHPNDEWAKRARALVPDLDTYYTPPCTGLFKEVPQCDSYHAHSVMCGSLTDVCVLCGKTNAEHR